MREIARKYLMQFLAIAAGLLVLTAVTIKSRSIPSFRTYTVLNKQVPSTVLWAWERPEDLSFLKINSINKTGIAYLAKTLSLNDNAVGVHPRFQPLRFPEGASLIPVVRIESEGRPALSAEQRAKIVFEISELAHQKNIVALQIDFDAKQSERNFYRGLLTDLRRDWPAGVNLSITALASWCMSDTWIKDLPIDEAVPMLFRMGADNNQVRGYLKSGSDFSLDVCRYSIGISTDEVIDNLPSGRRVYIFNPRSWNQQSASKALKIASRDQ